MVWDLKAGLISKLVIKSRRMRKHKKKGICNLMFFPVLGREIFRL